MEIKGKVNKILDLQSGVSKAGKEWKKQDILIDTGNDFNPIVLVTAFGDEKIKSMNQLEEGGNASILCNVYSREFGGKYYTSIDGYWFSKNSKTDTLKDAVSKIANPAGNDDLPF